MAWIKYFYFALLCVFHVTAVFGADTNPTSDVEFDLRIVGGDKAKPGQFPYVVAVRDVKRKYLCGGTIYSETWIIATAYCIKNETASNVRVAVGSISIIGGLTYRVSQLVVHEEYDPETTKNNIGLIQTAKKISFTRKVQSIPLSSQFIEGGKATFIGWGKTKKSGPSNRVLNYIETNVITNSDCVTGLEGEENAEIFDVNLCTFTKEGEGACYGDGGGPLVQNGALIAIHDWRIPCAEGFPDVFNRISSYISWIQANAVQTV